MPTVSELINHPRYKYKGQLRTATSSAASTSSEDDDDRKAAASFVATQENAKPSGNHHVDIGLEPLDLSTLKSRKRKMHSDTCGVASCCVLQKVAYTEVLFKPELLPKFTGPEGSGKTSSNPLLELCLDGGLQPKRFRAKEGLGGCPPLSLSPLSRCCATRPFGPGQLQELKVVLRQSTGCDLNSTRGAPEGGTALHHLVKGCTPDTYSYVVKGIYLLLLRGIDLGVRDAAGDTALTALHHMLRPPHRAFVEVGHLTHLLVQWGADLNHVNNSDRTLLSYSVTYGDASAELTRLLINRGGRVWPMSDLTSAVSPEDIIQELHRERRQSAFTWFLQSVVSARSLAGFCRTLFLLGSSMGEDPARLRQHVVRVMMHLGPPGPPTQLAPLFRELRELLAPFWTQPQSLRYLCLQQLRRAIGPKKLSDVEVLQSLSVPNTMLQYLQLAK